MSATNASVYCRICKVWIRLEDEHGCFVVSKPCPNCNGTGRIRDNKAFGVEMQAKRKAAKATLRDVATRMGKSIGYISDLEHGRKRWRGGLITAYMDALSQ